MNACENVIVGEVVVSTAVREQRNGPGLGDGASEESVGQEARGLWSRYKEGRIG